MSTKKDALLRKFLAEYDKTKADPRDEPRLEFDELLDSEDLFFAATRLLGAVQIDDDTRALLRGKRAPDQPDQMAESAEGLRHFPDIAAEVQVDPALFEKLAARDLSIGGLILTMQALHRGVDTEFLLCGDEARKTCTAIDRRVAETAQDLPEALGEVLTKAFAVPQERREQVLQQAKDTAAGEAHPAAQPHPASQPAQGLDGLVRGMIAEALAGKGKK